MVNEVRLEKGAHVEITVTAERKRKLIEKLRVQAWNGPGKAVPYVGSRTALRLLEKIYHATVSPSLPGSCSF
jgi:hypothetical protein